MLSADYLNNFQGCQLSIISLPRSESYKKCFAWGFDWGLCLGVSADFCGSPLLNENLLTESQLLITDNPTKE